jgi:hypothetical protein
MKEMIANKLNMLLATIEVLSLKAVAYVMLMEKFFVKKLDSVLDSIEALDLKAIDYVTLIGVFVAVLGLFFTYIWRKRDRKRKLIEQVDGIWNSIVEVSYRLRTDCNTLRQKFEFSDIKQLNMQDTIEQYDQLLFKKTYDNAKNSYEAFQTEAPKLSYQELMVAKITADKIKTQLTNDAINFRDRMSLAYEQLEKRWSTFNKSC